MTQEIEIVLRKWPMIKKYLGRLIYERRKLPFSEGDQTDSIAMIALEDANLAPLEGLLERTCDTPNFASIFERLGNDRNPDEKIYDALAVVQAIDFLKKRDYKNIEVVPKKPKQRTVDLIAKYRNKDWAIEVKHIRGLDFKRLIPLGSDLGYKMDARNTAIVKKTLKSRIDKALVEQTEPFCANDNYREYKRAVIIASRGAEFWLFPDTVSKVLSQLFESCYQGKLDKIMLLVGFYDPAIVEYPCRKDIAEEA